MCKESCKSYTTSGLVSPNQGPLKLNFDGTCARECDLVGFSGMIREQLELLLVSFVGRLQGCFAIEAEFFALCRGVPKMEKIGAPGGILEGDSQVIMIWA